MKSIILLITILLVSIAISLSINNKKHFTKDINTTAFQSDPYEDWQINIDKEYSIEFKTPSDWEVEKHGTESGGHYLHFSINYGDNRFGGVLGIELFDGIIGRGTAGPKISEETILISGVEATKKVFEGDGILENDYKDQEEKIYRDLLIEFKQDNYFYAFLINGTVSNSQLWEDVDLLIKSIKLD